ncbi:flavodoxin domain-containing protein [Minwuia sp.]|uniref:flavodoxin domain-containing protein n=1 Tax=Minwuia sp. TaxID=2493630 RepID=UPI003A9291B2
MSDSIVILVGTMTGTAEMVAEDMQAAIEEAGDHDVDIRLMDDLDATAFDDRDPVYLIVTSTYGQGEVPDNALDFFEALTEERPDLSGVRFGIFGLGDATYADTFNHGGERFEKVLKELGARQIGERHAHDASGTEMPEDTGVEWVKGWLGLLESDQQAA